jgi:hypothetical protein
MAGALNEYGLTQRQEKFCRAFRLTGNASEAYRQSFECPKAKPATINRKAKALLDMGKIEARIRMLEKEDGEAYKCTIESLAREFDDAAKFAREVRQAGALVSALEKKGKLFGLFEKDNSQKSPSHVKGELHPALRAMMDYRHDGSK